MSSGYQDQPKKKRRLFRGFDSSSSSSEDEQKKFRVQNKIDKQKFE